MRYLFTIFYRLNSGGVRLNNQEIRNCIYTGVFNDELKAFDHTNLDWKNVMEIKYPGELSQLQSKLGALWKKRCDFAHADIATNINLQQRFDAPSWTLNEFEIIRRILEHFESILVEVIFAT